MSRRIKVVFAIITFLIVALIYRNYQGISFEQQIKNEVKTVLKVSTETITLDVIDLFADEKVVMKLEELKSSSMQGRFVLSQSSKTRLNRLFDNIEVLKAEFVNWDELNEDEQFELVKAFTSIRAYLLQE